MDEGMTYWLSYDGKLLGPGPLDGPTGWEKHANLTHRIMKPQPGQLVQAISWCGRRIHEVPGHGAIDCCKCLDLLTEAAHGGK